MVATAPIPAASPIAVPAKKKRAPLVFGGLLLVAAGVAAAIYVVRLGKESTDDAQVEAHVSSVAARISGQVTKVLVNDNQAVQVGDVLVELDDRKQQVRLTATKASLAVAKAQLHVAQTQLALTDKTAKANLLSAQGGVTAAAASAGSTAALIDEARSGVSGARSHKTFTSSERARTELLHSQGVSTQAELDTKIAADQQADAQLADANARLANAQASRGNSSGSETSARGRLLAASTIDEQVEAAQAQVELAQSHVAEVQTAVDDAQLDLEHTKVRAEIHGTVAKRSVEPGQTVDPSRPLMAIVDLDDTWVVANLKETQLADIKPGQAAEIEIDSFDGTLAGHVDSVAAGTGSRFSLLPPENASGNFTKVTQRVPVKIVVDKHDDARLLRPGMSAEVTIHTK